MKLRTFAPASAALRAALVSASLVMAGASAQANLLSNASFESGAFVSNGQQTMSLGVGSTTITGWVVVGDTVAWINAGNPFGLSANDGAFFLDLTDYAAGAPFGGVSQTIATTVGATYLLSFDLGASTAAGRPSAVTASAADTSQTFFSPTTGGNNDWQTFSMSFVATGASTTISLLGQTGNSYIGLDNVNLVLTAVPEPMSAALMLAGLVALGAAVKKRRAAG